MSFEVALGFFRSESAATIVGMALLLRTPEWGAAEIAAHSRRHLVARRPDIRTRFSAALLQLGSLWAFIGELKRKVW